MNKLLNLSFLQGLQILHKIIGLNLNEVLCLYVKISSKKNITYVGYTNDISKRLSLHNKGKGAKFTRGRKWELIYKEKVKTKSKAISREYYIKNNRTLRNNIKNKSS